MISDDLLVGVLIAISVIAGTILGFNFAVSDVESNELPGYHCAPIVKVKRIEEAKSIIEAHQKRIGSIK